MAIRNIASSLIAKAQPEALQRKTTQARIEKPEIPQKAKVGNITRSLLEEPLERRVPVGSEKVVSATPIPETASQLGGAATPAMGAQIAQPSMIAGGEHPRPAMGVAGGAAPGAGIATGEQPIVGLPEGMEFRGAGGQRISKVGQLANASEVGLFGPEGRVEAPEVGEAQRYAQQVIRGTPGEQVAAPTPTPTPRAMNVNPIAMSAGSRVIAAPPGTGGFRIPSFTYDPGFLRTLLGGLGSRVDAFLRSMGSPTPELGLTERAERAGGPTQTERIAGMMSAQPATIPNIPRSTFQQPQYSARPPVSPGSPVRFDFTPARSVAPSAQLRSQPARQAAPAPRQNAVQQAVNFLKGIFGRR